MAFRHSFHADPRGRIRAIFPLPAEGVDPPSPASGDGIDKSGLMRYKIVILVIKPRSIRRGNPPVRVSRVGLPAPSLRPPSGGRGAAPRIGSQVVAVAEFLETNSTLSGTKNAFSP